MSTLSGFAVRTTETEAEASPSLLAARHSRSKSFSLAAAAVVVVVDVDPEAAACPRTKRSILLLSALSSSARKNLASSAAVLAARDSMAVFLSCRCWLSLARALRSLSTAFDTFVTWHLEARKA